MVTEVLDWGLRPAVVSVDSWYSGVENLKFLREKGLGFLIGLEKNRIVSERAQQYVPVEGLEWPEGGKVVHLRKFGFVTVFRTLDKNGEPRHYAQYDPRKKKHMKVAYGHFVHVHRQHSSIGRVPSGAQASLPYRAVLCALEAGHWQSCLLRLARLPEVGGKALPGPDCQLVRP